MKFLILAIGLAGLLVSTSEAKMDRQALAEIFSQGQEPSQPQGKIKWKCMQETEQGSSENNCASNYGFQSDGRNFKVPEFGTVENGRTSFEKKGNALVFTQREKDGTKNHLAVRSIVTPAGPRLIMEESSTVASWQDPNKKSSITGFTPTVYVICAPEAEVNNFMTGQALSSTAPSTTNRHLLTK